MARIFSYGKLNRVATLPNEFLPGQFTSAQGVHFGTGAVAGENVDFEFGEVVAITGEKNKSLVVKRATATLLTSLAVAGVIVRDVVGQRVVEAGQVEGIRAGANIPFTVIPLSAPKGWEIAIPVGEEVEAGDTVFIGNGSKEEALAGAGYKEQKDSTGCLQLTGFVYATDSYKPTSGAGLAAIIRKA